jgi:type III secretion system low calcium response chaperone LcrH/SycD
VRWDSEEQERLYAAAYGLYELGDYARAAELFTELVLSDAFQERYWRGLAGACQMHSNYQEALHAWALVALLAERDPTPHFHAAECLLSIDDQEEGLKALKAAEARLGQDEESQKLYAKIEILKGCAVHAY